MKQYYGGYDPGGKGDPAAFVIVESLRDHMQVVFLKTYLAKDPDGKKVEDENLYTRFTSEIADIHKKVKLQKLLVDQTGLGQPIIEHCKDLKLPAEGLTLSSKSKEELLSNLKILLEQKKLVLPPGELNLLANLNCIQAERSRTGGFLFSHPHGTHDDLAFALALACYAASGKITTVVMLKRDEPEKVSWRSH
jgi:phage FluMu gp28-like protein